VLQLRVEQRRVPVVQAVAVEDRVRPDTEVLKRDRLGQQRAQRRLMLVVPLSLGLIAVLLFFAFGSVGQAMLEDLVEEEIPTDGLEAAEEVLVDLTAAIEKTAEPEVTEEVFEQVVEEVTEPEASTSEEMSSGDGDEFLDELEFLESLSLDDPESFDAVSRMLEEEGETPPDGDNSDRGGAG